MKILFTGTSSFTGYWLIQQLAKEGHHVTAICRKKLGQYEGLRKTRLERLQSICSLHLDCSFGSKAFVELIESESNWDLFCHHAAVTKNYKRENFDFARALQQNTANLPTTLKLLQKKGCNRVLLTGSVFEPGEGGTRNERAVSSYGLSKGLTDQVFSHFAETFEMKLGKFVIPNPFGPYEDPRFTTYLVLSWMKGKVPIIQTPAYVRDNIHVDLLSQAYAVFAKSLSLEPGLSVCRPSGYVETQREFTQRFAREIGGRLSISCPFECKEQSEFLEPIVRANTERLSLKWDESAAWDLLANYYQEALS